MLFDVWIKQIFNFDYLLFEALINLIKIWLDASSSKQSGVAFEKV